MDVANNLDRGSELEQCGLTQEDFAGSRADGEDFSVLQADRLGDFSSIRCILESLDHVVKIHGLERGELHGGA